MGYVQSHRLTDYTSDHKWMGINQYVNKKMDKEHNRKEYEQGRKDGNLVDDGQREDSEETVYLIRFVVL